MSTTVRVSRHVSSRFYWIFLCKELHFSAAAVEVMNSDKPSHLLSIIPVVNLNFVADSKKDFLKSKLWNGISFQFSYRINVYVLKK